MLLSPMLWPLLMHARKRMYDCLNINNQLMAITQVVFVRRMGEQVFGGGRIHNAPRDCVENRASD